MISYSVKEMYDSCQIGSVNSNFNLFVESFMSVVMTSVHLIESRAHNIMCSIISRYFL